MRGSEMHKDGVPFRICLHFARNPGVALFVEDISQKWGVPPKLVWARLKNAKASGWIEAKKTGRETYYIAGPALLTAMETV